MPLAVGAKVDRYVVEGLLGTGGMAEVYAVRHSALGSAAALKVLTMRSPVLIQRLQREGRAQAALQHPNIVAVLDLIDVDGAPGLVMERVAGPTLGQLLTVGSLGPDQVDRLAAGLMLGLAAAHARNIVHRDLKPSNILVAPGEVARIADFGLATALGDDDDLLLTRPGSAIGTPAYMAPEQTQDARSVDPRADVFALAAVLYEALTGRPPVPGSNLVGTWQKLVARDYPTPRQLDPGIPARMEDAILWGLQPELDARAPSVGAMWERFFETPFPGLTASPPPFPRLPPPVDRSASGVARVGMIPRPSRALVGRATEFQQAWTAMSDRGGLTSLVGTGGAGKTRLAVELARRWMDQGRVVQWADLQAARHTEDLIQGVGWLLDDPGDGSVAAVGRALDRRGALLVVLDNLEQLPRTVQGVIETWRGLAPSVRFLATSRSAVGGADEQVIPIGAMAIPADPGGVFASEAWRLLRSAAPTGALQALDADTAHALLAALEGLPLAIELAAARLQVLDVAGLLRRLEDRFAILSDPDASGQRHGALYATIDWSWSLLAEPERAALRTLAQFRGHFGIDASEAVVGAGPSALDAVHGLVRRNLIERSGPRFHLPGSIRAFALRQTDPAEQRAARRRHGAWHAAAGAAVLRTTRRGTPKGVSAVEEIAAELEAVIQHADDDDGLSAEALTCARALVQLLQLRGPTEATLRVTRLAIDVADRSPLHAYAGADLRIARAVALRRTGKVDEARAALDAALQVEHGEIRAVASAHMADLLNDGSDYADAPPWYERSLALAHEHGPSHLLATNRVNLASALTTLDRLDPRVGPLLEDAVRAVPDGDLVTELLVQKGRGWCLLTRDEVPQARAAYLRVVELARSLGDVRSQGVATGQLGLIEEYEGDLPSAEARYLEAETLVRAAGDTAYAPWLQSLRGRVWLRMGRTHDGIATVAEALAAIPSGADRLGDASAVLLALAYARGGASAAVQDTLTAHRRPDGTAAAESICAAFVALAAGDASRAEAHRLAAVASWAEGHHDGPLTRYFEQVVAELRSGSQAWRVAVDGSLVHPPGLAPIDLRRHTANARILSHLLRARLQSDRTCEATELAEAGWPGERMIASAAGNRVRVALSALRRAGLGALIERSGRGWRLDPALPLRAEPV